MAVDKLVDSTALDTGLTTVANAIRTKGGTSAQLSFPQGMADAVAAIQSGSFDWLQYSSTYNFASALIPYSEQTRHIVLNIPRISVLPSRAFGYFGPGTTVAFGEFTVEITTPKITNCTLAFIQAYQIKKLIIHSDFSECTNYENMLNVAYRKTIFEGDTLELDFDFDFSSVSSASNVSGFVGGNTAYVKARFVKRTLSVSCGISKQQYFLDETLVSFANCLVENLANTLTLHADVKAQLLTIKGYVDASNDFVADDSGTVSLSDFITQTKGWTLA